MSYPSKINTKINADSNSKIRETFKQNSDLRILSQWPADDLLLFDGAMGTLFAQNTSKPSTKTEAANRMDPDTIVQIHKDYIQAGCKAIKTNTYSLADELAQNLSGQKEEYISDLIQAAVFNARQAIKESDCHEEIYVFADLGPISAEAKSDSLLIYQKLISIFLEQGVRNFLMETLPDTEWIDEIADWLKNTCSDSFLLVSIACAADGITRSGKSGIEQIKILDQMESVDAVGFNCMCGPSHLLNLVKDLPELHKPLSVMPNAGYPSILSRRTVYDGTPDYFASGMISLIHHGTVILGGCCGTTPEHISALFKELEQEKKKILEDVDHLNKCSAQETEKKVHSDEDPELGIPNPNSFKDGKEPGILLKNHAAKRKSYLVELDPPANDSISFFLEGVSRLKHSGADMVTIADNPIGRPRADSSILACKIKREAGIEVLPHMTCRDRNLNAIKALLLGLSIEDVHHVLLVTGDPLPSDLRQEVRAVYSFNSRTLAGFVKTLGESKTCTPFHMYGALDINARNFDVQIRIAKEKEANGMEGFLTQPAFSDRAISNLKRARKELKGLIMGGLMPIVSYKNALFLANEISGMDIPESIIEKYKDLSREEAEQLALSIVLKTADQMGDDVDGYYIMTPFKRVSLSQKIVEQIRKMEEEKLN
ncbi:bifunctional homocysteine S-methyltransferase/methylenetetrahydrofolate reductase [Ileibacterium valens]|uniref:bifunctional homocysteine S-methyltransferase/methylenetetrahydrofolate reductase n=1 Tax=Ileibacterium valens TaxID=1862668 RepID=UPI002353B266|nr:bifunctional homocysteine S-methyltransferase/methylenetetrahydrofolate reductase [Ileibacterium valens]